MQCLDKNLWVRPRVLKTANDDFQVFKIEGVSEYAALKALSTLKGAKSRDVELDSQFFKNYRSLICKPLINLINLSI